MDERLACLEQRLAEAECQVRRLRRAMRLMSGLCFLGLAGGLALASARPAETRAIGSTVRAPFRVVDGKGKTLLAVDAGRLKSWDEQSGARLQLFDAKGQPTASLMSSDDGGALSLDTRQGKRSVGVFASTYGGIVKIVHSPEYGQPAVLLGATGEGSRLFLYNRTGRRAVVLDVTDWGEHVILRNGDKVEFTAP